MFLGSSPPYSSSGPATRTTRVVGSTRSIACLTRSFNSPGAVPPMSTPGSSLKPWKATAWAKRRLTTESRSGKHAGFEVRGRDVPARKRPAVGPPTLAPPGAGELWAETLEHPLSLLVGVLLDRAAVGRDGDEVGLGTVVVQPLDQLAGISGSRVAKVRIHDLRVDDPIELVLRTQPPQATGSHPHDGVRRLVQHLAHRVQRHLILAATDPHLPAQRAVNGSEQPCRRGTVLPAAPQVVLGVQLLLDRQGCGGHAISLPIRPQLASRPSASPRNIALTQTGGYGRS